jgi:ABC-type transporter Mla subunit MlaD
MAMSPYRRNVLVGATVLAAMLVFGWMLLSFGTKSATVFAPPQMEIHLTADRADGLSEGSAVTYLGISVGRVTSLELTSNRTGVNINAVVKTNPPLPKNVKGVIRPQSYIGTGTAISLETDGPPSSAPLAADAYVDTAYVGNDLFPHQFTDAADEAQKLIRQFRESNVVSDLDTTVKQMTLQFNKAGTVLDSLQTVMGDPKMQENISASIADFRKTSDGAALSIADIQKFSQTLPALSDRLDQTLKTAQATVAHTDAHVEDLSKQINDRLQQASALLIHRDQGRYRPGNRRIAAK